MKYKDWINDFSSRLNRIMIEKGITQKELAERVGISVATISRYCNGKQAPSSSMAVNLSKSLGCKISDLAETREYIE